MIPRVSVTMAVWNGESYLDPAITSVLSQSVADFELIIVDDGSTDRTSEIIAHYAATDPRIRAYRRNHEGMIRSFNFAAEQARSEFLVHFDGDDISLPNRIEKQLAFMKEHPSVGLSGTQTRTVWPNGVVMGDSNFPTDSASIRSALDNSFAFCHSAIIIRKDAFWSVGAYRTPFTYAEDLDLYLRVAEKYEMANLDEVLVLYRIHGNQVSARHVEQQVLSALAVRFACEARRQGASEALFLQEEGISRSTLKQLGVADEEIDRRILKALDHHLGFAFSENRPEGLEREVAQIVTRIREFCRHRYPDRFDYDEYPLIAKILTQEATFSSPG